MALDRENWAKKIFGIFLFIVTAITLVITFWRLHFGLDLTDESFYSFTAYRFARGARPFIEELLVQQTASLLLAIPVKAFLLFRNSLEGIVLFTRYLFFIFQLFLSFFIYKTLKKFLKPGLSLLIALTCVAFVLYNLPNFYHDTLGWGFLTLGFFLGLFFIQEPELPSLWFFPGLFLGLAAVSYPTLVFIGITYPLFLIFLIKEKKVFLFYYLGLFLPFLFIIGFLFGVWGIRAEDIQLSLNYTLSSALHTSSLDFERLRKVLVSILSTFPYFVFLPSFLLAGLFSRRYKAYFPYLMLVFPILPLAVRGYTPLTVSHGYILLLSFFYPLLYFLRRNEGGRVLFFSVWLPSFLASLLTAYTSSNGYKSAAVGAFPGALVTLVYLALILEEGISFKGTLSFLENFLKSFPLVLVLVILLFFYLNGVYRDDPLNLLKIKIKSGAFKGLYTSKAKSKYIFELTEDLKRNCSEKETIFFYDRFPGGYLLTKAHPLTNTTWVYKIHSFPKTRQDLVVDYFKRAGNPDVVVKVKVLFNSTRQKEKMAYPADYLIDRYFKAQGYKLVVNKESYEIYRRL